MGIGTASGFGDGGTESVLDAIVQDQENKWAPVLSICPLGLGV